MTATEYEQASVLACVCRSVFNYVACAWLYLYDLLSVRLLRHQTPAERARNDSKPIIRIMYLVDKQIMPVREPRLGPTDLTDDRMLPGA